MIAKVTRTKQLDVPAAEVWGRIGGFHRLHEWLPGIEGSTPSEDGKVRELALSGGAKIVEELIEQGDSYYTYKMTEGPLPVRDCASTLRVRPEGDASVVEWEVTFEPDGIPEEQAVAIIEGVYDAGLGNL